MMQIIANIIRGVKRNAKIMEEEFAVIFALSDESLDDYEGNLEEVIYSLTYAKSLTMVSTYPNL